MPSLTMPTRAAALSCALLFSLLHGTGAPSPAPFAVRGRTAAATPPPPRFCAAQPSSHGSTAGRRYVVMASDATAGYAFYLPLSVRVWAEVAGFESIVVLVGAEWREQTQLYTAEVISALDSTGATVVVLDVPPGSYTLSTVAQLSRLLVACGLELQPEDFLMVIDVDMWPLSTSHYASAADELRKRGPHGMLMHDAWCCGGKPVEWQGFRTRPDSVDVDSHPQYYRVYGAGRGVGASVVAWRQIIGGYLAHVGADAALCRRTTPGDPIGGASGQGRERSAGETQALRELTIGLIQQLLVTPLRMGLLGNSNRGELEHSGRYAYGQFEWELDQRVLGLAVKMWGHCCPSSTAAPHADMPTEAQARPRFQTKLCWQIALPKRAMLDRLEQWPPDGAAGATAGVDVLNGRIMAHLPMQGRGPESLSGYAEQGWRRVRWLLQHLPARESPRRSGNAGAEEENVSAWAEGYRTRFNDGLAQEVIGGVVSVVDAASLQDLARLLALISGMYGRSVYVLVYCVGLSDAQVRQLQLWRNVLAAAVPTQAASALDDVQQLRFHALLDAVKHPLLGHLRTILYLAPSVRVCSGALELAFQRLKDSALGSFAVASADATGGCHWGVLGYLRGGAAWLALERAMAERRMPELLHVCDAVPSFLLPHTRRSGPQRDAAATGFWQGFEGCDVLDTVYTPLIRRKGVVMVIGQASGADSGGLVADLLGLARTGDDAQHAGNCSFIPYSAELLTLTDAVVAPLAALCPKEHGDTEREHAGSGNDHHEAGSLEGVTPLDGQVWAVLVDSQQQPGESAELSTRCRARLPRPFLAEGHNLVVVDPSARKKGVVAGANSTYGGVWVAANVCEAILAQVQARMAARGAELAGIAGLGSGREAAHGAGMVIVTAASRNFFGCLRNLVGSIHVYAGRFNEQVRLIVVYDIGLSAPQRAALASWRGVQVRPMPWDKVGVGSLRLYAWKIGVWLDAVDRFGAILFLDACCELRSSIAELEQQVAAVGVFLTVQAESTPANIDRDSRVLTHPAQARRLVALYSRAAQAEARATFSRGRSTAAAATANGTRNGVVRRQDKVNEGIGGLEGNGHEQFALQDVHCWAGLVGLNGSHARTAQLLHLLRECAADADCIAPLGSNLSTHRYEQSALSIALQLLNIECRRETRFWAYLDKDGQPSVPLPDHALVPSDQAVVFARRRHTHKPFWHHLIIDPDAAG